MVDWAGLWETQQPIAETLVRSSFVYLVVHLLLRLAGRKELSRYSSFDVAVLFLIGVAVRRAMTVDDASLTTATLALATVIAWDVFFSWLGFRSTLAATFLKGKPRLLVKNGVPLEAELRACRISMEELLSRGREAGLANLARVAEAYLETDGKVSFVVAPA
ncbi:MAG TPA: YetF domain-containing protein [Marmoricola sp.]|jgi:uncharacterized membrane protein YcaP (DUF421 family)